MILSLAIQLPVECAGTAAPKSMSGRATFSSITL